MHVSEILADHLAATQIIQPFGPFVFSATSEAFDGVVGLKCSTDNGITWQTADGPHGEVLNLPCNPYSRPLDYSVTLSGDGRLYVAFIRHYSGSVEISFDW